MIQSPLKIAIAQMDPTVGDFPSNTAKILRWIHESEAKGADLVVFPEGALCGYPVWDLANKKQFVDEGLKSLKRIAAATKGKNIAVVLGFIDQSSGNGERGTGNAYNAAAWVEGGEIRAVYHKQLLPTYDVFLEDIFFKAGSRSCVMSFKGRKVGLTICEDIWDASYDRKPLRDLKKKGVDLVINISASPYFRDVAGHRERLVSGHARKYKFPVLYVNLVGGQDDLLFDGRSFLMDSKGRVSFRAPAFREGLFFCDWHKNTGRLPSNAPSAICGNFEISNTLEMYQALVMGVRDYFRKNGFKKAVIGLSGGIDSALVATIAVDALGKDAVKGVTMPGPFSSEGSWKDSEALAKNLGIEFEVRPIKGMYETFLKDSAAGNVCHPRGGGDPGLGFPTETFGNDKCHGVSQKKNPSLAMENLQARLRGLELMFLSNDEGRLVLTTGNKSELAMGYCTLYGDMAGGLAVIGDVYKTDVYRLARYRNTAPIPMDFPGEKIGAVPTTIMKKKQKVLPVRKVIPELTLTKAPSAELRPNQKDQDSLPPYEVLDEILCLYIEKNLSRDEIVRKLKRTGKVFMSFPHVVSGNPEPGSPIKAFGDDKTKRLLRPVSGARDDKSLVNLVADVTRKVDHNEYKRRQTPPILRVTEKAWFGRRMPITNRFFV